MKKIIYCALFVLALSTVLFGCGKQACVHANQMVFGEIKATCLGKGYTGDTECLDCGVILKSGKDIPMLEHTPVVEGEVPATCLTGGRTGVATCQVCKIVLHQDEETPATGHTKTTINARKATCTATGYTGDVVCSACGEVFQVGTELAMKDHDIIVDGFKVATCKTKGYSGDKKCKNCNAVFEKGVTVSVSHVPVKKGYKAATCVSEGSTGESVCNYCGIIMAPSTVIPKLEHKPATSNAKAASCFESGYSGDVYCTECKTTLTVGQVLPARGAHGALERKGYIPATTTSQGYSGDEYCVDCGELVNKGQATQKLPTLPEYGRDQEAENLIFQKLNDLRAENGIAILNYDELLGTAAYNRVREYIYCHVEGKAQVGLHQRPDGSDFRVAVHELGVCYSAMTELIAGGGADTLADTWMSSPEHKASVLNAGFTHVSVCVVNHGSASYAVAIFHNGAKIPVPQH